MHLELTLAALASVASLGVIVRMVLRQMRRNLTSRKDSEADVAAYVDKQLKEAHIATLTITVTNKETNASVQLPPHYDRAAVSRFLEITA